jgi:glutathione S-transferase
MQVPLEYGYVIGTVGLSHFMNIFLTTKVIAARKKFKVEYPTLYLPHDHKDALEYNSAQRAHQNTLESLGLV